jgi:HAD superfamily hydrolase (TIGR01509 family)
MRGAIFDLDGTLVDNMSVHMEAFAVFAERHSLPPLTLEDRKRLDGRRNRDIFPDLFGRALSDEEQRAFAEEKEALYRDLSSGRLVAVKGLDRLLECLNAAGIPAAIATSAPPDNVEHTLAELGLTRRLACVVRGDQVPRGKPFPDVFLAAAARLGVPAAACVAFEDAPIGIVAARAAGMQTVAIANSFAADVFLAASVGADVVVRDFDEYLAGAGRWLADQSSCGSGGAGTGDTEPAD